MESDTEVECALADQSVGSNSFSPTQPRTVAEKAAGQPNELNKAIFSDDPAATCKIAGKVAQLEERQARMKLVNQAHAKFLKNPDSNWRVGLTDVEQEIVRTYKPAYSWEPHPFAPFQLTNNSANIRRLKERSKQVEKLQAATKRPERHIGDVRINDNMAYLKVELHFPGKPSGDVRAKLKAWGFHWVPSAGCWSRGINAATEARLQWLADLLGQPITIDDDDATSS